jgi:hypothetical protein
MASAHSLDVSVGFSLVEMDGVFRKLDAVYDGFLEFGVFMPSHALWVEDATSYFP